MTTVPLSGHIEPLSAVLRIGGAYGEPYRWAATVRYLSPEEVELVGVDKAPTPSEWRAIRSVLVSSGVPIGSDVPTQRDLYASAMCSCANRSSPCMTFSTVPTAG